VEHPSILRASEVRDLGSLAYVEMPFCPATLDDLIDNQREPWPAEQVTQLLRRVAAALDAAYAQGIVHGALCPRKILLTAEGSVAVNDFTLGSDAQGPDQTVPPSTAGDAPYMAPEQWRDSAAIDGRIDQFSLGVIAFEILSGRRRWRIADWGIEIDPIDVAPGTGLPTGISAGAMRTIQRATAPNPAMRFASATEFVDALASELAPVIEQAAPAPPKKLSVVRAALLVLAGALLGAVSMWPPARDVIVHALTSR
jgi:serine/threonine protein kinase